ncbi:MAG TPA: DUF3037 domain-containing protein [Candidatus Limnocylindrales bacterium]|nr:DUF3037 domain-containing protein [Candidatus Limnocylindrales bacterium]
MSALVPTQFSVLKFVPDPIRDEPLNVGVVARIDGHYEIRALEAFSRLRSMLDTQDLDSLAAGLKFLRSSLDRTHDMALEDLISRYGGQFKFGPLLGALVEDPLEFLDDQFDLYVQPGEIAKRAAETEDRAKIRKQIAMCIAQRYGRSAEFYALRRRRILGATSQHTFDFGFSNGRVTLLKAISFQNQPGYALGEAKLAAFAVMDTREVSKDTRFAAVLAPPKVSSPLLDDAYSVLMKRMDVVIESRQVADFLGEVLSAPDVKPISSELRMVPA